MDVPIWTKFSGVSSLVTSYLVVGSTSAQSPPVMTWPAYSTFPCSLSPPWSWVLPGVSYHFEKYLTRQTIMREWIFDFRHRPALAGYKGGDYKWGHNFFANWQIFHKIDPFEI